MTTNVSTIVAQIRSHIDEPTARFYKNEELIAWVNEALRDIARRSETIQSFSTSISLVAGTNKYTLPTDVIRVHRIEAVVSGSTYEVEASTYDELSQYWGNNQLSGGTPRYFAIWGFPPNLSVQLYPAPASAGTLNVWYYRLPAAVNSEGDILELPEGWQDLVVLFAEFSAKRKARDATWQEAKMLYEERLSQLIDLTRQWHDQAKGGMLGNDWGVPSWLYEREW